MSLLVAVIEGLDLKERNRHAAEEAEEEEVAGATSDRSGILEQTPKAGNLCQMNQKMRKKLKLNKSKKSGTDSKHKEREDDGDRNMRRFAFKHKCWSYFVDALEWCEDVEEPPRSGPLYNVVHSNAFENFSSAVIVANCAFTAYVANWNSQHVGERATGEIQTIELAFLSFYFVELVLRMLVHRIYFFFNEDSRWNCFDFLLVLLSIVDEMLSHLMIDVSTGVSVSFVRIFRIMKLAKIFRTLRVMKVFKDLAIILESFKNCVVSLFWCFVMMAFIFYVFALVLLQGMTAYIEEAGESITEAELLRVRKYFGSLETSMLSLYMAVTGGDDWGNCYEVVKEGGALYAVLFLFFTFFFAFAVFNILTGVFVEKAVAAAAPDAESRILEQRKQELIEMKELREICQHMDENSDGMISLEEFQRHMGNEYLLAYLSTIGLEIRDGHSFFDMLSTLGCQDGGKVDLDKFVKGCLALKGNASTLDVERHMCETMAMKRQLTALESKIFAAFEDLERRLLHKAARRSSDDGTKCAANSSASENSCASHTLLQQLATIGDGQRADPAAQKLPATIEIGQNSDITVQKLQEKQLSVEQPPLDADFAALESQEKVPQESRSLEDKEDKATPLEFQWLLERLREELVTGLVPQVASSICKLVEPQLVNGSPAPSHRSTGLDRQEPGEAKDVPVLPKAERAEGADCQDAKVSDEAKEPSLTPPKAETAIQKPSAAHNRCVNAEASRQTFDIGGDRVDAVAQTDYIHWDAAHPVENATQVSPRASKTGVAPPAACREERESCHADQQCPLGGSICVSPPPSSVGAAARTVYHEEMPSSYADRQSPVADATSASPAVVPQTVYREETDFSHADRECPVADATFAAPFASEVEIALRTAQPEETDSGYADRQGLVADASYASPPAPSAGVVAPRTAYLERLTHGGTPLRDKPPQSSHAVCLNTDEFRLDHQPALYGRPEVATDDVVLSDSVGSQHLGNSSSAWLPLPEREAEQPLLDILDLIPRQSPSEDVGKTPQASP